MLFFGNSITWKVEKQKRIEGEVEVLKKQQKVEVERITKENEAKRKATVDQINAEIAQMQANIASLKQSRTDKIALSAEELKVSVDKAINDYNRKIVNKQNKAKKLGYYIDAEQRNIQDVINPEQPNAPTSKSIRILNEDTENTKKTTKKWV